MNFFETQAGYDFLTFTFPCLVKEIEKLNILLENRPQLLQAGPPSEFCRVCQKYHDGQFSIACQNCVRHSWCEFSHINAGEKGTENATGKEET